MSKSGRGRGMGSAGGRSSWTHEAGRASLRGLIALLLIGSVVYVGFKVLPVYTATYQFHDAMRDEILDAASRRRASDDNIRRSLLEQAAELGLPVVHQSIAIRRPGRRYIVIEVDYTVDIEFIGGYVYSWHFTPQTEGPLNYSNRAAQQGRGCVCATS